MHAGIELLAVVEPSSIPMQVEYGWAIVVADPALHMQRNHIAGFVLERCAEITRSQYEASDSESLPHGDRVMPQSPRSRLRPRLHSIPPPFLAMPATCWPSFFSISRDQGTSWNPSPSSIMAKRPDDSIRR